ncbi:hypothetical protein CDAR_274161 [Caerostris darwini]|uniref:Secreted protein n=1 Tax=Caerostris darwini TaxID=1538125 RepID=A0AAV4RFZ5_9ARAC|nr:hypothetical protein CDAR_274161 [Caerostris darwini]
MQRMFTLCTLMTLGSHCMKFIHPKCWGRGKPCNRSLTVGWKKGRGCLGWGAGEGRGKVPSPGVGTPGHLSTQRPREMGLRFLGGFAGVPFE